MLSDIIKSHIAHHGPMDVGVFMAMALGHPRFGYYMRRDPFGADGDFTTAPEISQMFGELIGAWAADQWRRTGSPKPFTLAEAGPGRGTLMADALRATRGVPEFHASMTLRMLETSPVLREKQAEALKGVAPHWHEDPLSFLESGEGPLFVIANEFLDALPVRQMQVHQGAWRERVVGLEGGQLTFGLKPADPEMTRQIPDHLRAMAKENDIYEIAPARSVFMGKLCGALRKRSGVAVLIDYGHAAPGLGDTLQAVRGHNYVHVLGEPGMADITSHVDFSSLASLSRKAGCTVEGPIPQGEFLNALGLRERASILEEKATPQQKLDIQAAVQRLTDKMQMGELFKVLVISSLSPTGRGAG